MRLSEPAGIKALFGQLFDQKPHQFPKSGGPTADGKPGVYVVHGPRGVVLHVGKSCDVRQRLNDHLFNRSSFSKKHLDGEGKQLRNGRYAFRYLLVEDGRSRALLEAYAIGILCPKHIGHGYKRAE